MRMILLASLLALTNIIQAAPNINLPINAQVPPVARTDQPFNFVFSNSTFTSSQGTINYSVSGCPSWLQLDAVGRTFSGTPDAQDAGSLAFDLVATDDSGSTTMSVVLVVSSNTGPGLGMPVSEQLPANLSFASPDSLKFGPSSPFSLSFSSHTFMNTDQNTVYYAFCANNTPLPAWMTFDPATLSFTGTTPSATSSIMYPQTFSIVFTASDVRGFSGATASFQVILENHVLAFRKSMNVLNVTAESLVNSTALQAGLTLDGAPIRLSELNKVSATPPSWLNIDTTTLVLSGTPDKGIASQNFTVNATDVYGDIASTLVLIQVRNESATDFFQPTESASATIVQDPVPTRNDHEQQPTTLGNGSRGQDAESDGGKSTKLGRHWIAAVVIVPVATLLMLLCVAYRCVRRRRKKISKRYHSEDLHPCGSVPEKPMNISRVMESRSTLDGEGIQRKNICTQMSEAVDSDLVEPALKISRPPKIERSWASGPMKGIPEGRGSKESFEHKGRESWQSLLRELNFMSPRSTVVAGSKVDFATLGVERRDGASYALRRSLSDLIEPSHSTKPSVSKTLSRRMKPRLSFSSSDMFCSTQPMSDFGHGRSVRGRGGGNIVNKGIGHGDGGSIGGPFGHGAVRISWRNYFGQKSNLPHGDKGTDVVDAKGFPMLATRFDDRLVQATKLTEFPASAANGLASIRPVLSTTFRQIHGIGRSRRGAENQESRLYGREVSGPLEAFHHNRVRQRNSPNPLFSAGPSSSRVSSRLSPKSVTIPISHSKISLRRRVSPKRRSSGAICSEPSTPKRRHASSTYSRASSGDLPSTSSLSRFKSSPSRRVTGNLTFAPLRTTLINSFSTPVTDDGDSRYEDVASSECFSDELEGEIDDEGDRRWSSMQLEPPRALRVNTIHDGNARARRLAEELVSSHVPGGFFQRLSYLKAQGEESSDDDVEGKMLRIRKIRVGSTRGKKLDQNTVLAQEGSVNKSFQGSIRDAENSSFL